MNVLLKFLIIILFTSCLNHAGNIHTEYRFSNNIKLESDTIFWESENPLQWTDFKGEPDYEMPFGSFSYIGLFTSIEYQDNQTIIFKTRAYFLPKKSWHMFPEQYDSLGLRHEQYHFNIAEYVIRKFRKELSLMTMKNLNPTQIENRYNYYRNNFIDVNELYDKETMHNYDTLMQQKWEKAIDDSLKLYAAYAEPIVAIK